MTVVAPFLFPHVLDRVSFPHSLAFVQLGAFHRPAGFVDALKSEASGRALNPLVIDDYIDTTWAVPENVSADSLVILDAFERVLDPARDQALLSRLRPLITEARQTGARFLLLSRLPPSRYPVITGSSLVLDAQV